MSDRLEKLLQQEEQLRRDRKLREQVFGHYGQSCACCGAVKGLTIDHINGDGKAHRAELTGDFYAWLVRNGFPPGFQVLCIPCNSSKGTGLSCKMHDDLRSLKKLWLALTREQRIAFLAWMPELDPGRPESIWGRLTAGHPEPERRPELDHQPEPEHRPEPGWRDTASLENLATEYQDFKAIVSQIPEVEALRIHPARRQMREVLAQAGSKGARIGDLHKALAAMAQRTGNTELGAHRGTLHRWLRQDEEDGCVRRVGGLLGDPYAQWTWIGPEV